MSQTPDSGQQQKQSQQQDLPSVVDQAPQQPPAGSSLWEFADIGFDTGNKFWFIQLFNAINQNVGFYSAKKISMNGGCAIQYQWKDNQGRPFWHVRERFQASDVEGFQIDVQGNLVITFKKEHDESGGRIPKNFAYLQYAYHLTSKETAQSNDVAPLGFVEFCNQNGEIIGRLNNRWIVIESASRVTTGELPRIRIRVNRQEIETIISTGTTVVIVGKGGKSLVDQL